MFTSDLIAFKYLFSMGSHYCLKAHLANRRLRQYGKHTDFVYDA